MPFTKRMQFLYYHGTMIPKIDVYLS